MHLQVACLFGLQPISKVFWLKAPSNHLFELDTAYSQGVFGQMRLQIACLIGLQPISKVFWLNAPSNHLFGCTAAFQQGVLAKSASKSPVWLPYSLLPRRFG